jgi:hypothetical protein
MSTTEDLIRAVNPVTTSEVPRGDSPQARRLLATLPARRPAPARRRRPRVARGGAALAAAATAAIVAAVAVAPGPGHPGHPAAARVPAPVTGSLRDLVLAADRQPAPSVPQPGQFQYTDSVSLQEDDTIPGSTPPYTVDYSQHRQIWIGTDGSGRIAETNTDPVFPTPADRAHWVAGGSPSLAIQPDDSRFGKGGLSDGPGASLATLTTDPARLARLLSGRQIEGGPPGPAEDFVQVGDLFRETDAPPALRAALFQVAARIPGVRVVRGVTDHDGRPGIALVRDTPVTRGPDKGSEALSELIFDPATSVMLGEEYGTISPSGAVTLSSWTVYLKSFVTDSVTSVTPVS